MLINIKHEQVLFHFYSVKIFRLRSSHEKTNTGHIDKQEIVHYLPVGVYIGKSTYHLVQSQ